MVACTPWKPLTPINVDEAARTLPTAPPARSAPARSVPQDAIGATLAMYCAADSAFLDCQYCRAECDRRVGNGDGAAADALSRYFASRGGRDEARQWTVTAAELGHCPSVSQLMHDYAPQGPLRNAAKLSQVIDAGATRRCPAALLAKAAYLQDIGPHSAAALYIDAATQGDCAAALLLAVSYLDGAFTELNEAKAYYWWRVARRENFAYQLPPFVAPRLARFYEITHSAVFCSSAAEAHPRLGRLGDLPFAQLVDDAFLDWRPGREIPAALERYKDVRSAPPTARLPPAAPTPAQLSSWRKVAIGPRGLRSEPTSREDLYAQLQRSVYVVFAAPSQADLVQRAQIAQGSAVAVLPDVLLTNCHIFSDRPWALVLVSGQPTEATILAANLPADTCVLLVAKGGLVPITGIKPAKDLRVGETVFAIGSPSGLQNSLSEGLVSQIRTEATSTVAA